MFSDRGYGMTIEMLAELGANVEEGVKRCAGNEAFYLKMISKALEAERYNSLSEKIREKDMDKAFEEAHALKGILANLSLEPILKPVNEMTEFLRSRTDMDYTDLINEMRENRDIFVRAMGREESINE